MLWLGKGTPFLRRCVIPKGGNAKNALAPTSDHITKIALYAIDEPIYILEPVKELLQADQGEGAHGGNSRTSA
jgi:hypothetical protein